VSFPRYPNYKESGVEWLGVVPEHWKLKRVGHIADLIAGFAFPSDQFAFESNEGIPLVRGDNVTEGWLRWGEKGRYWPFGLGYDSRYLLAPNDIVIQMDGSKVGKNWAFVSEADLPALLVQRVTRVRVNAAVPRFIYSLFSNEMFVHYVDRAKTDPAVPHITMKNISDYWVPLPPESEQVAIVCFLDRETSKIDSLVAEQRRLIELLKEKRQAVISHAVTKGLNPHAPMKPSGIQWLGDVPAHWQLRRVKTVSSFVTSGPRGWSERIGETGSLFVQSGDLNDQMEVEFMTAKRVQVENDAESTRTRMREGDVVVCVTGAKTGNVAVCNIIPEPAYVNQHLCLIRPTPDVLPSFLGVLLKSRLGQIYFEISQYGLKQGLSLEDVEEAPVILPPVNEQQEIIALLDTETAKLDALTSEAERAIELLQERRTALISAAVTGKIDVRHLVEVN
jgi:type I restriction enzyme S subunit